MLLYKSQKGNLKAKCFKGYRKQNIKRPFYTRWGVVQGFDQCTQEANARAICKGYIVSELWTARTLDSMTLIIK